jgi:hypothetical protein
MKVDGYGGWETSSAADVVGVVSRTPVLFMNDDAGIWVRLLLGCELRGLEL